MRVAYVCTDPGIAVNGEKGASIHVRELSGALSSLGHQVRILALRAGGEPPAGFDVPVTEIRPGPSEKLVVDLLRSDPEAGEAVAGTIRSMLFSTSFRDRAMATLRAFQPEIVYERYSLMGMAGISIARESGIPLILEVNAPLSEEHANHRGLAFEQTVQAVERKVLCSADHVITVSEELRQWVIGAGVESAKVTVLPNAVNAVRFDVSADRREQVRAQLDLGDSPVIGFVGTLKPWHGTETLIRAMGGLRREGCRAHLLIVGNGPERWTLEELAEREGIDDAVTFAGAVPHEDIPGYVAAMDITVAPYPRLDGFYFSPLKVFEYMAAGRAVIAANTGQIRDCIQHGRTGWLYPPGDTGALAEAIRLLLQDRALASALGDTAQRYVGENHTWTGNARAVESIAHGLVRSPVEVR